MISSFLLDGCERLGLNLAENQLKKLDEYADLVLDFNKTYNLMKADSKDALVVQHILDSLAGVPQIELLTAQLKERFLQADLRYADIGAGGGCPGIPLSIAFSQIHYTFVERMEKRCAFLERCKKKLDLQNVDILCTQASLIEENAFHLLTLRAFHPFEKKIARLLLGLTKPGGFIVAYKARLLKIQEEMDAVKEEIPSWQRINLKVPFLEDHERNLVVIQN